MTNEESRVRLRGLVRSNANPAARTLLADDPAMTKSTVRQAVHHGSSWIQTLARLGYAAKGVVYSLIGILALQTAFGSGGEVTDSSGAFAAVLRQPFGKAILYLIALGLLGYALWRIIEAFNDPEGHGNDAKGLAVRAALFVRGFVHGLLAAQAFRFASRGSGGGGGNDAGQASASVMSKPFGEALLIGIGVAIVGYGLYQLLRAWRADLGKRLDIGRIRLEARQWIVRICRTGIAARGVVFLIIGGFLVQAALKNDPGQATGLAGALSTLRQNAPWLFVVIAAGLIAYGIYEFVKARYRRIST